MSFQGALKSGGCQVIGGIRIRAAKAEVAEDGWIVKLKSLFERGCHDGLRLQKCLL